MDQFSCRMMDDENIITLYLKNNRVYMENGDLVKISGFSVIHGEMIQYGEGVMDEQMQIRMLYDPVLIRCIAQSTVECDPPNVLSSKISKLIEPMVDYSPYFKSGGFVYLVRENNNKCI